ncbi:MAG: HEPN domain-containing protein [Kiritimatiellia bacterium]|nr:HEPN domain-containing protein [Kiritimatiellia bacterium]
MKNHDDLARAWWRKGESDLTNARMCLAANQVLDTACFHAQQAAEKYLKAYMSSNKIVFPFIHNLEKLVEICAAHDPSFAIIKESAQSLTPFAVEARYDENFWPDTDTARKALYGAEHIRQFIADRLPESFRPVAAH